jgi:hypothetical protein
MKFHRRPSRSPSDPEIKILLLAALEEHDIVTVFVISHFIDLKIILN